jgi:hypothetical protein
MGGGSQVGTPSQSYQETPQENLVIGVAGAVDMLDNILRFDFEVNGSVFTRDVTSSPLKSDEIPALFSSLYTARLSTSVDYAHTANLQARFEHVTLKGGYRCIGPGYNSLGVASMMTDQRQLHLGGSLLLAGWSATLKWSRQNDNLIGQKLNTTVRQLFSGSTTFRPLSIWNATFLANILSMRTYADSENQLVDLVSTTLSTNQALLISRQDILRSVGVSYTFQSFRDRNPLRSQNSAQSHTISGTASMQAS